MRKPGCTEPVFYFVCGDPDVTNPPRPRGFVLIAPYSDCPAPVGYRREYAETLPDIRRLEETLVAQERQAWEHEAEAEEKLFEERHRQLRDKLYARMISSSTDEWEKEFIRLWLQLRDEKKRRKYNELYLQRTAYLWALHNDTPRNRGVDEEKVSVDRINIS